MGTKTYTANYNIPLPATNDIPGTTNKWGPDINDGSTIIDTEIKDKYDTALALNSWFDPFVGSSGAQITQVDVEIADFINQQEIDIAIVENRQPFDYYFDEAAFDASAGDAETDCYEIKDLHYPVPRKDSFPTTPNVVIYEDPEGVNTFYYNGTGVVNLIAVRSVTSGRDNAHVAWHGFQNLTVGTVDLPDTVVDIGGGAFYGSQIGTLIVRAVDPPLIYGGSDTFGPVGTLVVPRQSLAAYLASDWSTYVPYDEIVGYDTLVEPEFHHTYFLTSADITGHAIFRESLNPVVQNGQITGWRGLDMVEVPGNDNYPHLDSVTMKMHAFQICRTKLSGHQLASLFANVCGTELPEDEMLMGARLHAMLYHPASSEPPTAHNLNLFLGGERTAQNTHGYPAVYMKPGNARIICNLINACEGLGAAYLEKSSTGNYIPFLRETVTSTNNPKYWSTDSENLNTAGVYHNPVIDGYTLLTLAEWEYAARYQDGINWTPRTHPSGCPTPAADDNEEVDLYAWNDTDPSTESGSYVRDPLCSRLPNQLGIYDMNGWCTELLETNAGQGTANDSKEYRNLTDAIVQNNGIVSGMRRSSSNDQPRSMHKISSGWVSIQRTTHNIYAGTRLRRGIDNIAIVLHPNSTIAHAHISFSYQPDFADGTVIDAGVYVTKVTDDNVIYYTQTVIQSTVRRANDYKYFPIRYQDGWCTDYIYVRAQREFNGNLYRDIQKIRIPDPNDIVSGKDSINYITMLPTVV